MKILAMLSPWARTPLCSGKGVLSLINPARDVEADACLAKLFRGMRPEDDVQSRAVEARRAAIT
jgi:hypothetical protein